jgi:hypothetical protein
MGAVLPEVAAVGACAVGHSWCQALQISLQAIAYWLISFSWFDVFITITTPNHALFYKIFAPGCSATISTSEIEIPTSEISTIARSTSATNVYPVAMPGISCSCR